jgi:hypothetical protein
MVNPLYARQYISDIFGREVWSEPKEFATNPPAFPHQNLFKPTGQYFGGTSNIFRVPSIPSPYDESNEYWDGRTFSGGWNLCSFLTLLVYCTADGVPVFTDDGGTLAVSPIEVGCSAWGSTVQINTPPGRDLSAVFQLIDQFDRSSYCSNHVRFISGQSVVPAGSNSCS